MLRIAFTALLAMYCASLPLQSQASSTRANSTYCSQAETYARKHADEAQIFAAVPVNADPARDHWRRIPSSELRSVQKNSNSTAAVTLRQGRIVYIDAIFQNQFGDSTLRAQYCFRNDGTLAQLHSELTSYHGGMKVVRTMAFDGSGKRTMNQQQSFDLETGRPRSLPSDFWDFPPPMFLNTGELPFGKELRKRP